MNDNKKAYLAPAMREAALRVEYSFLASATGENANPEDGYWDN